ncbi:MAG: ATPase domain-containing protein [Oligoflexales bacterium]
MKTDSAGPISTGVHGLDQILMGGLPRHRLYLVEGSPGTGKTTFGLQFLMEGQRNNEVGLYVSLSETKEEIEAVAKAHGWSLDGIQIFELAASEEQLSPDRQYTMFRAAEVELTPILQEILKQVELTKPSRIVFDSLSELRIVARESLRFRRQILALKQFFAGRQSTVLLLEDKTQQGENEHQLQSLCHGVICLEQSSVGYGAKRRRLDVIKMRGTDFKGGFHDYHIRKGGIVVYPRLIAAEHHQDYTAEPVKSGAKGLDDLLGGGLERGTSNLFMGASGTGKTTLAVQYATALAEKGERSAIFSFDETTATLLRRSQRLGIGLKPHIDAGRIKLMQIDPAEMVPGEFIGIVANAVENDNARMIVIDSLNGYLNAMPEERFLVTQMHELFSYLNQRGILTILVVSQAGLIGDEIKAPVDVSYVADSVIYLRYFEANGAVKKAISVVKKRSSDHEDTIREFRFSANGLDVGEVLLDFQGVLAGNPIYTGSDRPLLEEGKASHGA